MKLFNILIFLITLITNVFNFQTIQARDSKSTIERVVEPTQVYGPEGAEVSLKIGNGGAGPTCVLQALSEDFIESENLHIRIGWLQTISRLTLENLKEKIIDLSLTYEAEPELQALKEGWASDRALVFNDHFLLVGPTSNPADVQPSDSIEEAFQKIAKKGAFFSRNDGSGSNARELSIWHAIHVDVVSENPSWYVKQQVFPAEALKKAEKGGLYTLTDRGTLLAIHKELTNTSVYIQNDAKLMNRCHAMLQVEPSVYAMQFLNYLKSQRAQNLIATYAGKNPKKGDCPLFTPMNQDNFLGPDCLKTLGFIPRALH